MGYKVRYNGVWFLFLLIMWFWVRYLALFDLFFYVENVENDICFLGEGYSFAS